MAVASAPILAGFTLAPPKQQDYNRFYRGGVLTMANGAIVRDLVDTVAKHSFRIRWEFLTLAQTSAIQNAWDAIKNTTATYTSVTGGNFLVTQPENANFELTLVVTAGGDIKYHVAIELVETL